jgi:hypothetical protein
MVVPFGEMPRDGETEATMSDTSQGEGWYQASDGKWYPPQPPARKKPIYKRVWFWALVVIALIFGGCSALVGTAAHEVATQASATHTITYSITGNGTADVTYDTFNGSNNGTAQDNNVALPWSKTETSTGFLSVYTLEGQLQSGDSITCTITLDGKQIAHSTSSGAFSVASCSGTNN